MALKLGIRPGSSVKGNRPERNSEERQRDRESIEKDLEVERRGGREPGDMRELKGPRWGGWGSWGGGRRREQRRPIWKAEVQGKGQQRQPG